MFRRLVIFVAVLFIVIVPLSAGKAGESETEMQVLEAEMQALEAEMQVLQEETEVMVSELKIEVSDNEDVQKKVEEVQKKLEAKGLTDYTVDVQIDDDVQTITVNTSGKMNEAKPFMGITYSELTLAEAAEMGYEYFYGIHLDTVVNGSAAYYYRLRQGDMLMQINENKIVEEKDLGRIISYYRVGDKVSLKIFRDGKVFEKPFVFGSRQQVFDLEGNLVKDLTKEETAEEIKIKKQKVNYGDGTIAWIPSWFMPDVKDMNKVLHDLDFEEETFSEDGFMLNGIGFKGNIDNGWFLGGQYSYYEDNATSRHAWDHFTEGDSLTTEVKRKVDYICHFGGPTLDKRFIFGKHFYGELGIMIAWGQNSVKVYQNDDDDSIGNLNFEDNISDMLDNNYDYISKLEMKNNYVMFEPRASIGWRVTDWLSFKAEAAYDYSYSPKGWEAKVNGKNVDVTNAPDTKLDGLRISFGPWFGF